MERTSIITRLMLSKASNYNSLTLVGGLPDAVSLTTYFTAIPYVTERADFQERTEDSPQGSILSVAIRAAIHRDATEHLTFANTRIMAYIETANGEKHLFGSDSYPLTYDYERDSGAGNADDRFTTLRMTLTQPVE